MNKLRYFICLPWIVLITSLTAKAMPLQAEFFFRHLTNQDGLSNSTINRIIQGPQGYMWFATQYGLHRFDGYRIKPYLPEPANPYSIAHREITGFLIDQHNDLIISSTAGIQKYEPNSDSFRQYINITDAVVPTHIISMYQDTNGDLWVGTKNSGLWQILDDRTQARRVSGNNGRNSIALTLNSDNIMALASNIDDELWIATENGINIIDTVKLRTSERYAQIQKILSNEVVRVLKFNSDSTLWVGTEKGLFLADPREDIIVERYLEDNDIRSIHVDSNETLWIGTLNGLIRLDTSTNTHIRIQENPANPDGISGQMLNTVYESSDGILWIGSHAKGVNILNPESLRFGHLKSSSEENVCIAGNLIYASLIDSRGDIWLGASEVGLTRIKLKQKSCKKFDDSNSGIGANALDNIVDMVEDTNGDIWFATYNRGLVQYKYGENVFVRYMPNKNGNGIKTRWIRSVNVDDSGNIWVGAYFRGLIRFTPGTGQFTTFDEFEAGGAALEEHSINAIAFDGQRQLWLATMSNGVMRFDPNSEKFHTYTGRALSDIESATALSIDSNNNLWIASEGQGVFKFNLDSESLTQYSTQNGLNSDLVYQLKLDGDENVWVSGSAGIAKIDQRTQEIVTYTRQDGLQNNEFTNGGSFNAETGQMLFAGINGINLFDPKQIKSKIEQPSLAITNLSIPGIETLDNSQSHGYSVDLQDGISLPHNLNLIQLEFAGLHYADPDRHRYAYRMLGMNEAWTESSAQQRNVTFSNLAAGQYEFQFKTTDRYGNWGDEVKTLPINIATAPWLTWWAFSIYTLVLLSIVASFVTLIWRKQVATHEKQAAEQLNATKDRLFANVSHEFRTPLSLIIAPVSLWMDQTNDEEAQNKLKLIMRHAKRLSLMVDQFLSLARLEIAQKEDTHAQEISSLLRSLYASFTPLCENKNLSFSLSTPDDIWIDAVPDSMEIVFTNLISNAIKYTPDGGQIKILVEQTSKQVIIKIEDNGFGISPDDQKKVFQRFTRVVSDENSHIVGTGVGLALTKELVEKNEGQIELQSALDVGSTFTLIFPISDTLMKPINSSCNDASKVADSTQLALEVLEEAMEAETFENELLVQEESHKRTLLIIEDNPDIRQVLKDMFSADFRCLTANTGRQGLELGIANIPDIIITDLMMPELNGFEVVEKLRANELTCHIPMIMLTAKQDLESRIQGWENYVDAYLTKPFVPKEIQLVANNLLHIRTLANKHSESSQSDSSISPTIQFQITEKDQVFLDKFEKVVEEQFSSLMFNRKQAADAMFITEKQLSRKLKALQDSNFTDYLRDYRLEKAKALFITGKQVTQISDEVGFTSSSYFIKCFKEKYGITPHKYMSQVRQ